MTKTTPSLTRGEDSVELRADHRSMTFHGEQAASILKRWDYVSERYGPQSQVAHSFIINRIEQEVRETARA